MTSRHLTREAKRGPQVPQCSTCDSSYRRRYKGREKKSNEEKKKVGGREIERNKKVEGGIPLVTGKLFAGARDGFVRPGFFLRPRLFSSRFTGESDPLLPSSRSQSSSTASVPTRPLPRSTVEIVITGIFFSLLCFSGYGSNDVIRGSPFFGASSFFHLTREDFARVSPAALWSDLDYFLVDIDS